MRPCRSEADNPCGSGFQPRQDHHWAADRGWKPLPQTQGAATRFSRQASRRRVVITGIGPISAIGIGREDFWAGIAEGREGRRPPERLKADWSSMPRLAECLDFFVEDYLASEKTYLDRCSAFVLASCALALEDAGIDWRELDHARFGLSLGTAHGCLDSMHNVTGRVQGKGMRFASPMIFTHSFANSPGSLAAIEYDMQGPVPTMCCGDTSAGAALQYALDLVRWGRAEVVLAGGADALSEPLLAAIDSAGGLPDDGVPGEGACLLVLESAEGARRRGANVLGELAGVGLSGFNGDEGVAIEAALADAELQLPDIETCEPPLYGHTFGAELALRIAWQLTQLSPTGEDEEIVAAVADPSGRSAAAIVRSCE